MAVVPAISGESPPGSKGSLASFWRPMLALSKALKLLEWAFLAHSLQLSPQTPWVGCNSLPPVWSTAVMGRALSISCVSYTSRHFQNIRAPSVPFPLDSLSLLIALSPSSVLVAVL